MKLRVFKKKLRRMFPTATSEEVRDLLWCCTLFPFTKNLRLIHDQLRQAWAAGDETVEGALIWAHSEVDRAMEPELVRMAACRYAYGRPTP